MCDKHVHSTMTRPIGVINKPTTDELWISPVRLHVADRCTKFEVSRFTRYEDINGGVKFRKWGGLGWLGGTHGHGQCHHTTSYSTLIENYCLKT